MRLLPDSGYTLNHAKKRVDAGLEHQKQHRIDFGKGGRAAYNLTGNSKSSLQTWSNSEV